MGHKEKKRLSSFCLNPIENNSSSRSVAQSRPTLWDPWTTARPAALSITNSRSPPKLMSIESVMPCNHFILCHPLLLPPSIFLSIRVFSNESPLSIMWPKYWSFRFNISPSNEHSGLISFSVGSHVRHYWQNGGTVPNPSLHPAGTVLGWRS